MPTIIILFLIVIVTTMSTKIIMVALYTTATYLYVEPDRRKTPPPPKERILKKHTTDLKVGSMDELPSTEEPPSTPPVSPDGIAAAADSHPSEEVGCPLFNKI